MTNTITAFYPRLASLPEIIELVRTSYPDQAAVILQAMEAGTDLGCDAEELDNLITEFVLDQAMVLKSYKGLGTSEKSSCEAMAYLETNHPQAAALMQTQRKELERLLGKYGALTALGQRREPFDIEVLHWNKLYVVTAEDFEDAWFDDATEVIAFAEANYEPFIQNARFQFYARY